MLKRHVTFQARGESGVPVHYCKRDNPKGNILIGPRPKRIYRDGDFFKRGYFMHCQRWLPPARRVPRREELVRTSQRTHTALSFVTEGRARVF